MEKERRSLYRETLEYLFPNELFHWRKKRSDKKRGRERNEKIREFGGVEMRQRDVGSVV